MLVEYLEIIAVFAFFISFLFSVKLYLETDKGWYWLSFCISSFVFTITHLVKVIWPLNLVDFELLAVIQETGEIVGALFFAMACCGIYFGMKKIREKTA